MKIIDAHAHLCRNPQGLDEIVESGRFEQVWLMDLGGCNIDCHNFATEDEVLQTSKDYPGFFVPFGFLDFRKGPEEVDRLRERGFVGLKPYRPLKPWSDWSYFPFYQRASDLGMPILFHTGIVDKTPIGTIGENLAHGPANMRPGYLTEIASAFPDLTIIGGHLGYPWLEETALNLYFYPNIYHDLSGYRKDVEWLIKNLDRKCNDGSDPKQYFNDKILFASDAICYGSEQGHVDAFKLADFWELFLEMVGGNYYRWGEPEEREKIFYKNAKQLYDKFLTK